jgi:peptidase A4-like protein
MSDEKAVPTLIHRIEDFPIPPETLDLLTATPDQLFHFGLPPRPALREEPELYAVWRSFFVPRPIFVPAEVKEIIDVFAPLVRQTPSGAAIFITGETRYETSRNWCGAYIEANDNKVLVQVSGRWAVARPSPPLGAPPPQDQPVVYACSTWVGLDGQRRYLDSSLPQIGTWQSVTVPPNGATTVDTYAWVQWWAKDSPVDGQSIAPLQILSVPVRPFDQVVCMVRVWEPSVAAVYVKNLRTNLLAHFRIRAPTVILKGGHPHRYTISGATAEWIMERPTHLGTEEPYDLADFGSVELLHCHGVEADPTLQGWPWVVGTPQVLRGARFIRMYDTPGNRTVFISMPQRTGDASVRVTYGGFPG